MKEQFSGRINILKPQYSVANELTDKHGMFPCRARKNTFISHSLKIHAGKRFMLLQTSIRVYHLKHNPACKFSNKTAVFEKVYTLVHYP